MERLTKNLETWVYCDIKDDPEKLTRVIKKLCAYEDTGFEPEEIVRLLDLLKDISNRGGWQYLISLIQGDMSAPASDVPEGE